MKGNPHQILKHNPWREEKKRERNDEKFFSIPYVLGLSESLGKLFKGYNIRLCFKNNNTLQNIYTKLKSPINPEKITHAVYCINCNECNGLYIGQTMQYIKNRMNAHKHSPQITALRKHTNLTGHLFDFDNIRILNIEKNKKKREFLEMIQIKKHAHAINDRTDLAGLSKIYFNII